MKRCIFLILLLILFNRCVYDPPNPGPSFIYNCSEEAIYAYHSLDGELRMNPRLVLFEERDKEGLFNGIGCERLFKSPDYRIDAYEKKDVTLIYDLLGYNSIMSNDSIIFYFIKEKTMKELTWEEIVKQQRYSKRISLTIEEFLNQYRVVTYVP